MSLVVGARGALGSAVVESLRKRGDHVIGTTSSVLGNGEDYVLLPSDESRLRNQVRSLPPLTSVVFCQGQNINDELGRLNITDFERIMSANVTYTVSVLNHLVRENKILDGGRVVVVSSIWQQISRSNKFSYAVSKAAVGGLIRAGAADLAGRRILINAVLPGPIDNTMTRDVLTEAEIGSLRESTAFKRLLTNEDVVEVVEFLTSTKNKSITGESLVIDFGYSNVKEV